MTTTLRRVKKLPTTKKQTRNWPIVVVQPIQLLLCSHAKKSYGYYLLCYIYIHTIGSATLLQTYPLVAIPTVIIFPMKLTRKWFLIIVSAVTPVIYRLFIYECSIYSKLGIKKKNLSMKKKTFWYYVCDMMLSKPSSQRVALIWAAAAASRNSPIL